LKCSGRPVALPVPASPVQSCLKFSAVCMQGRAGPNQNLKSVRF
jgi:hypothetical protein